MTVFTSPIVIEDALALIAAEVVPLPTEPVVLDDTLGRVLAEDVTAVSDLPSFAASAMDGYAFRAADTPGSLRLVGESAAGTPFVGELPRDAAVAISTGAVIPAGADTVLPVELAVLAGDHLELAAPVPAGAHVRLPGSDIAAGTGLLSAGRRVSPAQIGAAAAAGLRSLPCHRRPRVALVSTGSELRPPGAELGAGEIYDSNGPMLRAALRTAGADPVGIATIEDTTEAHREAMAHALEHDVVITTGGVSVGEHDLVRGSGAALGVRELFWRVALRPGKPLWFGVRGPTLVFGLPGNPVSALVCFELFVRPALLALQGAPFQPDFRPGVLAEAVRRNPERDDLIRVRIGGAAWTAENDREAGAPTLTPVSGQQSHQIAVTARADGLARIPAGTGELPAGAPVAFLALHS
ncbi:MAG TPA: gephyrin-like molybdotransferase Glp [Solirubrobacteraceae bacterium]|nr:gephyrin-like molybdotransferase Glp [Solirubrobacteraceae bacterium]